jgi:hypothetical protein
MESNKHQEIVLNGNFGGFKIPECLCGQLGNEYLYDSSLKTRTHPTLLEYVKNNKNVKTHNLDLYIEEIPKDLYDASQTEINNSDSKFKFFEIEEYDGAERLKIDHEKFSYYKKEEAAKVLLSSSELTSIVKVNALKRLFGISDEPSEEMCIPAQSLCECAIRECKNVTRNFNDLHIDKSNFVCPECRYGSLRNYKKCVKCDAWYGDKWPLDHCIHCSKEECKEV